MSGDHRVAIGAPNGCLSRIATLERRMNRVEEALNLILERLSLPTLETGLPPLAPAHAVEKPEHLVKTSPYSYRLLDTSRNEIRILVLYSSQNEQDPVKGEIIHLSLDDNNPLPSKIGRFPSHLVKMFRALSYTWGNAEEKGSIEIGGHQFPVTENLEAALRFIRDIGVSSNARKSPIPSFWWIDAICINQEDILERNQQVTLMTRIYRRCFAVNIWLGEEADDSATAMELVALLGTYRSRGPGEPETKYPNLTTDQKLLNWKALTALFERPWWERCWVRQEVAVPKFATVHCGKATCTFDAITTTADKLNKMNEQLGFNAVRHKKAGFGDSVAMAGTTSCYLRACLLADIRKNSIGIVSYLDLKELLFHTRSCKATDQRDKVFSVLGLVDPELYPMVPDYRTPLNDTFKSVARCVITQTQSLDILSGCQNPDRIHGLPSWVPNLLDEWKEQPFRTKGRPDNEIEDNPDFTFEGEENCVLQVKSRRVGSIAALSDDTPGLYDTIEQLDALYNSWKALADKIYTGPKIDELSNRHLYSLQEHQNERLWVEFLSIHEDTGTDMRYAEDGKTLLPGKRYQLDSGTRNMRMVESLLWPKDDEEIALNVNPYRKIHENLRRFGVGRKLCFLESGSIGLVPAGARIGDECCIFRQTTFPYILRQLDENRYVVVGEACKLKLVSPKYGLLISL